ncbi:Transcriptional regulator [Paraburkholderia tropica]|nr:Transcriptional regulator [Paraburkholderia tropica]
MNCRRVPVVSSYFFIANIMRILDIVDYSQPAKETLEWEPKPEAVLAGHPRQSADMHFTSPCGQLSTGIWASERGLWRVNFTENEYCEILEGVSVLRDESGAEKTVRAGDRFLIPAGFQGTWEVVEPCRKVFVSVEFKG